MDSQKLDTVLHKPCSVYCYYGSACPKMTSEAISEHLISKKFPWGACPQTPLVLLAYTCIHITHPRNPLAKILATGLHIHTMHRHA